MNRSVSRAACAAAVASATTALAQGPGERSWLDAWPGYARTPQHGALAPAPTGALARIRWQTPVDLQPNYTDNTLYIHYGSPLITTGNTVIVTVKTALYGTYRVEGRRLWDGSLIWTQNTDYYMPHYRWIPSCGSTLTPQNHLATPAKGGTFLVRADPDSATSTVDRVAYFGLANYLANPGPYDSYVRVCTPITSDSQGNLFFGVHVTGNTPLNLASGIVRVSAAGVGTWVPAAAAMGTTITSQVMRNCAPGISNDGGTVYIAARQSTGAGYLLALDSTTLATISKVRLVDPASGANATMSHDGTSSPTVGPDGDVYYGVLENPGGSHHQRGWLLHFDATLTQTKIPGSFGWDDTASIVPIAAVPSYSGPSSYLLFSKYNNYYGLGGDGINRIAVVDPNVPMADHYSGATVMNEVMTIAGVTPDWEYGGAAVREWCINTAAVDVANHSVLANSEDGILYRWDLATNTFTESIVLTAGIGEAYTPVISAPDGTTFAINNGILFALGPEACPADINNDGFVDGSDSDLFNNLFEAGDPAADYNHDGFTDGIDYDLFNNDFEGGC